MVKPFFNNIRTCILSELEKAEQSIIVAVYWFTNETLFQKLISKVEQGIRVELIIHNDYINNRTTGLNLQEFIDKGGKFYFSDTFNPMHNKFCVVDSKVLINGSYNWTYYAEDRNRENVLLIENEQEAIDAFTAEFERLKSLTVKVDKITPLTRFEVDENNVLRARDYLANDIIYQAKATGRKEIVESAFQIAPENIEVQMTAFELQLTKKLKLKNSLGASIKDDGFLIIVPKDSLIPISRTEIVCTTFENQTGLYAKICFGESPKASQNTKVTEIRLTGLPQKPAGEAKAKYHFTINIYGNLRIEKYSLDNGVKQVINHDITSLLEEIKN